MTEFDYAAYWHGRDTLDQEPHYVPEIQRYCFGSVVDLGCGAGRYASLFAPESYLGVDINPKNIAAAKEAHPDHTFVCADITTYDLPRCDTLLTMTVLQHVVPELIEGLCARIREASSRQVLFESEDNGVPWMCHCFKYDYASLFDLWVDEALPDTIMRLHVGGSRDSERSPSP